MQAGLKKKKKKTLIAFFKKKLVKWVCFYAQQLSFTLILEETRSYRQILSRNTAHVLMACLGSNAGCRRAFDALNV